MYTMKSFLKALLVATSLVTTQAWSPNELCRRFPPSPGECAIFSFAGLGISWEPGPTPDVSDRAAIFLHGACGVIDGKDWEPQNPGFYVNFGLPSGRLVEATTTAVGPDNVQVIHLTIEGQMPSFFQNSDTGSVTEGLTVTWFRQVNYWCSI